MSSYTKHRFRIFNAIQHPYKHTLNDFSYTNPATGGQVSTIQGAMDYLFAVLYPQSKASVPTVADLPTVGNVINDMRVVDDDGDGKAASYRWEQREGEFTASWHKIYDMDWGVDSILQQMYLKTQDLYVSKKGYDERDAAGNVITGLLGGAYIYGGATANKHLTFYANSGDGTGASTGYVQFGDNSRPIADNTFEFGTTALRFKKIWSYEYQAGTLNLQAGSITDSSGAIDFGSTDLSTTGTLTVGALVLASGVFGTLTVTSGSITDTSGAISFGNENLTTTGTFNSGVLTVTDSGQTMTFDPDATGKASIAASRAILTFNALNLETTGTFNAGITTVTQLNTGNIRLDTNTVSITNVNGNLILSANGTGVVNVTSGLTTLGQVVTGVLSVTGQLNSDNLRLDGNTLSSTNTDGNVILSPNGTGLIEATSGVFPTTTTTQDLGKTGNQWGTLWIATAIQKGATLVTIDTLLSLRDINVGVTAGMAIFYDGAKWIASLPDTEITHGQLSGLSADDHLQYLLLAGRAGGQSAVGGSAASETLTLESTSHATKGKILTKDVFAPFTDATYSAGWLGTDLGGPSNYFRNVYTKGEFKNFRVENVVADFSSSSQNAGRIGYNTSSGLLIYDTGSAILSIGAQHSETDTSWNGTDTAKTVTISGVSDARKAIWQLKDNSNDFEIMYVSITQTNSTTVVITTGYPLPAGTYRLIGVQ